jgi:hypothetical protein
MLHENLVRNEEIIGPTNRRFGLTVGGVCIFVGGVRILFGHGYSTWWLATGVVLVLLAAVRPAALAPLNGLWLRFGLLLHKFVNPVVMALVYFSTIVPVGVLMRLSGKDLLRLKPSPDAESYWIVRDPPGVQPEDMKNQF